LVEKGLYEFWTFHTRCAWKDAGRILPIVPVSTGTNISHFLAIPRLPSFKLSNCIPNALVTIPLGTFLSSLLVVGLAVSCVIPNGAVVVFGNEPTVFGTIWTTTTYVVALHQHGGCLANASTNIDAKRHTLGGPALSLWTQATWKRGFGCHF
jgi:hypothetical protein